MYAFETRDSPLGAASQSRAADCKPIRLRHVDGGLVRLRGLLGHGHRATLRLGTQDLLLEASKARTAASAQAPRSVCLETPHGRIALAPSRDFLRVLTGIDLPEDGDDVDPLQRLAFDLAVQALPAGWLALFGASTLLAGLEAPPGPLELALTLQLPDSVVGIETTLRGSADALSAVLSLPVWQAPAGPSPLPADWRPKTPVRIGHATLSGTSWLSLGVGDVVTLDAPAFDLNGHGRLLLGGRTANCVLHFGNQAAIEFTEWDTTTANSTMDIAGPSLADSTTEPDLEAPLDDVPVQLTFELGSVEMTLSDLRGLAAGSVLPIAGAVPPKVQIRSSGRLVGVGELVQVDERLGIEIIRLGAGD
jgi:type III secretion protein Q